MDSKWLCTFLGVNFATFLPLSSQTPYTPRTCTTGHISRLESGTTSAFPVSYFAIIWQIIERCTESRLYSLRGPYVAKVDDPRLLSMAFSMGRRGQPPPPILWKNRRHTPPSYAPYIFPYTGGQRCSTWRHTVLRHNMIQTWRLDSAVGNWLQFQKPDFSRTLLLGEVRYMS